MIETLQQLSFVEVTGRPPVERTVVSALLATWIEQADEQVNTHNDKIVRELLQRQLETGEGCFFVGVCILSRAFYPDRLLPELDAVWHEAQTKYAHLLQPKRLLVAHDKLAQAFEEVVPAWGLTLSRYGLNSNGRRMVGPQMERTLGPASVTRNTYESLPTDQLQLPYAVLLHQAGNNDTHFLADDGTQQAENARNSYNLTKPPHRTIATFEFDRI